MNVEFNGYHINYITKGYGPPVIMVHGIAACEILAVEASHGASDYQWHFPFGKAVEKVGQDCNRIIGAVCRVGWRRNGNRCQSLAQDCSLLGPTGTVQTMQIDQLFHRFFTSSITSGRQLWRENGRPPVVPETRAAASRSHSPLC